MQTDAVRGLAHEMAAQSENFLAGNHHKAQEVQ